MSEFVTFGLCNIDPDDICEVLAKVENSFAIKFDTTELAKIKTFGELCDIIVSKIQLDCSEDCTTQQGFYKVRNAIAATLLIDKNHIKPGTSLHTLIPRQNRRKRILAIESLMGFKMKILRPKYWITATLFLIILASVVGLFMSWKIALVTLTIGIAGIHFANRFSIELDLQTVRQLVEKITREHYLKTRRDTSTINSTEIVRTIKQLFINDLGLEDAALKRDAVFSI